MTAQDEAVAAMDKLLDEAAGTSSKPPRKDNPVTKLTQLIRETFQLVHEAGRWYAVPTDGAQALGSTTGHVLGVPPGIAVSKAEMRRIVVKLGQVEKLATVTGSMADTVLLQLEASAFSGRETELALRFCHEAGRVVLDLGQSGPHARCVVIEPGMWSAGPVPRDVTFRRSHAIKPLPEPKHQEGVTLNSLAGVLALDPGSEEFRCILGWLAGLAFTRNVRPGLLLTGVYGSAKSTRLRLAASVAEPSAPDDLGGMLGRKHDDDEVRALRRPVPLWDNVTQMSGATSDLLCTIITGTSREGRLLYSNDDMSSAKIKRPVGLTAVATPAGLRPDALSRLIICEMSPPAKMRGDAAVQAAFDDIHAGLLAAWCDTVAAVLRWLPKVPEPPSQRMASHAHVLAALDAAVAAGELDGCPGGLLHAYTANVRSAQQQVASDDVFGAALLEMVGRRPVTETAAHEGRVFEFREWQGTAKELLAAAALYAPLGNVHATGWPATPRALPNALGHLTGPLKECGLFLKTRSLHGRTQYEFTLGSERPASA